MEKDRQIPKIVRENEDSENGPKKTASLIAVPPSSRCPTEANIYQRPYVCSAIVVGPFYCHRFTSVVEIPLFTDFHRRHSLLSPFLDIHVEKLKRRLAELCGSHFPPLSPKRRLTELCGCLFLLPSPKRQHVRWLQSLNLDLWYGADVKPA